MVELDKSEEYIKYFYFKHGIKKLVEPTTLLWIILAIPLGMLVSEIIGIFGILLGRNGLNTLMISMVGLVIIVRMLIPPSPYVIMDRDNMYIAQDILGISTGAVKIPFKSIKSFYEDNNEYSPPNRQNGLITITEKVLRIVTKDKKIYEINKFLFHTQDDFYEIIKILNIKKGR